MYISLQSMLSKLLYDIDVADVMYSFREDTRLEKAKIPGVDSEFSLPLAFLFPSQGDALGRSSCRSLFQIIVPGELLQ